MRMYNYGTTGSSILDGLSNMYLLCLMTLILAVIVALYCSNMLKESEEASNEEFEAALHAHAMDGSNSEDETDGSRTPSEGPTTDATDDELTGGLVGKLKSARLKELEAKLTSDQLEEERRIEREQLAAIFELLKRQEAELNMKEIDEKELTAQLNLYR